ncbi:uncharacterized protein [Amphiura filiformis]|uniref:uncharacterized protein n=1 Tax=Amphiura filiformis TaxID=82378 RepID=UPI003B220A45
MFIKKGTGVLIVLFLLAVNHQCLGDDDDPLFGKHGIGLTQSVLRKTVLRNCLVYRTGLLCKRKIPNSDLFHVLQIGQRLDTGPEDFERLDKLYKRNEYMWKSHAHVHK